jgi:hypothetical protein
VWDRKSISRLAGTTRQRGLTSKPANAQRTPSTDPPTFATLTSDEQRERKAEIHRPGTFAVVATPDSFSSLPEYAHRGRRPSTQSAQDSIGSPGSSSSRSVTRPDPNVVVLERFEEAAPPQSMSYPVAVPSRRPSMPDVMRKLSLTTSPQVTNPAFSPPPYTRIPSSDEHLTDHFRRNIVLRLIQPVLQGQVQHGLVPGSTKDIFELEAARYRPVSVPPQA